MGWFVLIYTPPTPPSTTCAWYSLLIKYVQTKVLVKKIRARWESGFWHLPLVMPKIPHQVFSLLLSRNTWKVK